VLLDEQHGAALLGRVLADHGQEALHDDRREAEAQLVQQQELRPPQQRPRDREHLLLAAGQQARRAVLELRERREVPVARLGVEPLALRAELEVLGDREAEEDPAALGHVGHAEARDRARADRRGVPAVDRDPALHRPDDPGHGAQRRRLARAVRAQQRHDLARADREVEVAHDRGAVVAGVERVDLQHRVAHAVVVPVS
jgi:hypothetical protein